MDERMKEKHNKRYENEVFQKGETVLVQRQFVQEKEPSANGLLSRGKLLITVRSLIAIKYP